MLGPMHDGKHTVQTCNQPTTPRAGAPVQSDMRLLKLYESGLPAWAIFLPSYGLWYRPWMRRVAWTAFLAISVFSMACGFYDLYKNVPFLKQVTNRAAVVPLPLPCRPWVYCCCCCSAKSASV